MTKVSAIIPVFNEEKTVAKVVETLLASPLINDVVCVNDGSVDRSYGILKKFGKRIKLLNFKENRGKGFALAEGVRVARGEIVAFFDADLVTLSEEHIGSLIVPLIEGRARAVLGYHPIKRLDRLVNSLTGERAFFREDLLPYLNRMKEARFGVEIFLNNQFKDITRIVLPGLQGFPKSEKFPPREAVRQLVKEGVEIAYEMGRQERARLQDFKLLERIAETKIKVVPGKVVDFDLLQERVARIQNEKVRRFLSGHLKDVIKIASRFKNRF